MERLVGIRVNCRPILERIAPARSPSFFTDPFPMPAILDTNQSQPIPMTVLLTHQVKVLVRGQDHLVTFVCYLLGAIGRQPDIDDCIVGQVGQVEGEQLIHQGGRMADVRKIAYHFFPDKRSLVVLV